MEMSANLNKMNWPRQRRAFVGVAAACSLAALLPTAFAQSNKRVRLLALEPGAQSDIVARALQDGLAAALNAPVVIENYGGAGGRIAAQMALRSEPDGNTLLVGGANNMVMSPLLSHQVGYDPLHDFAVIAPLATVPFALAVSNRLGVSDLTGLVSIARAAKQPLSGGSGGVGGSSHIALELLFQQFTLPLLHVPFRGTTTATQEVMAERIDLVVTDLPRLLPLARQGRLRIVGVTGSQRSALAPEIPTLAEQGATGFRVDPWYALYCRTEVPKGRFEMMATAIGRVIAEPAYLAHLQTMGFESWNDSAKGVYDRMKQDHDRVQRLIASGVLKNG